MSLKRFNTYQEAEHALVSCIVLQPDYVTKSTYEKLATGFILSEPYNNINNRSNYVYAEAFFNWMLSGEKEPSQELLNANPWTKRFVDTRGLPDSFSTSYGWKIKSSIEYVMRELRGRSETRRAYINILIPDDQQVLAVKDCTHEYPCTIGLQFFIRDGRLVMVVNMRSNNVWAVLPYDVYNFTNFQMHVAKELGIPAGDYIHQINNAHLFKADVVKIKDSILLTLPVVPKQHRGFKLL